LSKITNIYKTGREFISFYTAGNQNIGKNMESALTLEEAGNDLTEIGIPFLVTISENVVIQDDNAKALK